MASNISRVLNLRHLRAFVEVAHQGNFTRAADKLSISQPALTITIHQLEDLIGVELFRRTTRKVTLAPDGEDFLPTAERLIEDFEKAILAVHATAKRRSGVVDIAVLPSVAVRLLPRAIASFSESNPSIKVNLRDDNARGVHRQVRRNEVDFGISNQWEDHPELEFTPLFRDRVGAVLLPDHPLAKDTSPLPWDKLKDYSFAAMSHDTGINVLLNATEGLPESVYSPDYEVLTMAALAGIVEAGLAITALPKIAMPRLTEPSLVFRELIDPLVERQVYIITRKKEPLSKSAQIMLELLSTALAEPELLLGNQPTKVA
ncbi:MAG: LysR substrate-binding domain-containing protein [Amphritea sp.]